MQFLCDLSTAFLELVELASNKVTYPVRTQAEDHFWAAKMSRKGLMEQDLSKLDVTKLHPLSPEVISRQATINIGNFIDFYTFWLVRMQQINHPIK